MPSLRLQDAQLVPKLLLRFSGIATQITREVIGHFPDPHPKPLPTRGNGTYATLTNSASTNAQRARHDLCLASTAKSRRSMSARRAALTILAPVKSVT